ncbi:hypothetical protein BV898_07849 [Hypsibius exemplaris]|uniref:Uncharacterized protein n=1 Tax=Hypsibius exemplaris TaxID=2072580 RepID=A0A1W0WS94_HYPEX|nr:hypothetical protein BV898_07849 [Hypsibius exemplaris]
MASSGSATASAYSHSDMDLQFLKSADRCSSIVPLPLDLFPRPDPTNESQKSSESSCFRFFDLTKYSRDEATAFAAMDLIPKDAVRLSSYFCVGPLHGTRLKQRKRRGLPTTSPDVIRRPKRRTKNCTGSTDGGPFLPGTHAEGNEGLNGGHGILDRELTSQRPVGQGSKSTTQSTLSMVLRDKNCSDGGTFLLPLGNRLSMLQNLRKELLSVRQRCPSSSQQFFQ